MAAHAKIGPSSFSRVKACPASLRFESNFPNTTNPAAEEGTACHEAVERMLNGEHIEPGFVAENGIKLTAEHMAHVEEVFAWIADQEFDRLFTEVRVPVGLALGLNDPDMMWGTSDVVGVKGTALYVADAKFGIVPVAAETVDPETGEVILNAQGMCYLVGALHEIGNRLPGEFDELWIVILQPKAGGVKKARVSMAQVRQFMDEARDAVRLALSADAPFRPGESQCRYCRASGACKAQVTAEFEAIEEVEDPNLLGDAELSSWLGKVDEIIATAKAMKSVAIGRLQAGRKVPGYELDTGSGRAKWRDEEEVVAEIEAAGLDLDVYAPRKPTTQTALKAKSALGATMVEALVYRPPGEAKLVREGDAKRPVDPEFEALD